MFDLVSQFPIKNENAKIIDLHEEAAEQARVMAFDMGYCFAGDPVFQIREFPHGLYMECRAPVEEIQFGGGKRGR